MKNGREEEWGRTGEWNTGMMEKWKSARMEECRGS
jgi:hypothetical protein